MINFSLPSRALGRSQLAWGKLAEWDESREGTRLLLNQQQSATVRLAVV